MSYQFKILKELYSVCRLDFDAEIPPWDVKSGFYSITRTDDELSILCPQENVPPNVKCEGGWKILKIDSILDFSMVGVISQISTLLAQNSISIFVISTFDTDYICVKEENLDETIKLLEKAGNTIDLI